MGRFAFCLTAFAILSLLVSSCDSSSSNGSAEFEAEMIDRVREAGEGRADPEIAAALTRMQSDLTSAEMDYLAAVAWWTLPEEVWIQDPVFRRAMAAAAEPGRTEPPRWDSGVDRTSEPLTSGDIGASGEALNGADLNAWVRGNMRIVAAVGVAAVGTVGCATAWTGAGAYLCVAAIAFVASAILPANASEPMFESLPRPDTPAAMAAYQATVDPTYACPAGYQACPGEGYCSNLASVYRHCGGCGNVCDSGLCVDGVCASPPVNAGLCNVQGACASNVCTEDSDLVVGFPESYVSYSTADCGMGTCTCTDDCCTNCTTAADIYDQYLCQPSILFWACGCPGSSQPPGP